VAPTPTPAPTEVPGIQPNPGATTCHGPTLRPHVTANLCTRLFPLSETYASDLTLMAMP
jgi:hypothetical protein